MTNEELARQIQQGERDLILQLWEQVRRYAYNRAYKWQKAAGGRGGTTVEDLEQEAFLALLEALEGWDEKAGPFPPLVLPAAQISLYSGHSAENTEGPERPAPGLPVPGCSLD